MLVLQSKILHIILKTLVYGNAKTSGKVSTYWILEHNIIQYQAVKEYSWQYQNTLGREQ